MKGKGKSQGGTMTEKVSGAGGNHTFKTSQAKDCSDYGGKNPYKKDMSTEASGDAGGYGGSTSRGE